MARKSKPPEGPEKLSVSPVVAGKRRAKKRRVQVGRRKTSQRRRMTQARITEIASLLGICTPHSQIISYMSEKYKVATFTVREWLELCYKDMQENRMVTPDFRAAQVDIIDNAWRTLHLKALQQGKFQVAAKCLTELGKMYGLYAPEKHIVATVASSATPGFQVTALGCNSAAEVQARIEELRAKMEAKQLLAAPIIDAELVESDDD